MRLASYHKHNFASQVINSLPKVDVKEYADKIAEVWLKGFIKKYPAAEDFVKQVEAEKGKEFFSYQRSYYKPRSTRIPVGRSYAVPGWFGHYLVAETWLGNDVDEELEKEYQKMAIKEREFNTLCNNFRHQVNQCTTLNSLKDAFPELIKFMPQEPVKSKTAVAVQGQSPSDLVQALKNAGLKL